MSFFASAVHSRRCFESFVRNDNDAQREGDQNK